MAESNSFESQFVISVRLVGYGLLVLTLLDVIYIFVPPRFMDPAWEFQAFGALVEHVPVPLTGFGLVFLGGGYSRTKLEKQFLKYLSWLSLVAGILFLLMLPLGIGNAWRINNQNNIQVVNEAAQRKSQFRQLKEKLNQGSDKDMTELAKRFNQQSESFKSSQTFKDQVFSKVNNAEIIAKNQSKVAQKNRLISLLKTSVKWLLGALVSGILFICLWRTTGWARRAK